MRRYLGVLALAAALVPAGALAASWHHFSSKSFGFSVKYPSGWTVTQTAIPQQVSIQRSGTPAYSVQVSVPGVKAGANIARTLFNVKAFELSRGNAPFAPAHWTQATIRGHPAMVALVRPSTEGGVAVSDAIYVTSSRTHVYEITTVAYGASSLSKFPSVYGKILKSWRFL